MSVLIGVNDVVQGVPPATYAANVATILDTLLAACAPVRMVTVAIPDYTVTPAGADYGDPARQHDAIVAANDTMARCSAERGIAWVDIFDLSLRAADDRRSWQTTASTRAEPNTRFGWSGSRRSWRGCSAADRSRAGSGIGWRGRAPT